MLLCVTRAAGVCGCRGADQFSRSKYSASSCFSFFVSLSCSACVRCARDGSLKPDASPYACWHSAMAVSVSVISVSSSFIESRPKGRRYGLSAFFFFGGGGGDLAAPDCERFLLRAASAAAADLAFSSAMTLLCHFE